MIGTVAHSAPNLPILANQSSSSYHHPHPQYLYASTSSSSSSQSPSALDQSVTTSSANHNHNQPTQQQTQSTQLPPPAPSSQRQLFNNSTLLKLVQRLLDEASQTGELLLAARNLTEFPSKLALVYDLSDTIFAGTRSLISIKIE